MIIDIVKLGGFTENRPAGSKVMRVLSCFYLMSSGLLFAQLTKAPSQSSPATMNRVGGTASANPYKLEWSRHFQLQSSFSPVGAAEDSGTLWLITHAGPGKPKEFLTRIDSRGQLTSSYDPQLPLKPVERVGYLSLATSGRSVGLLASLASGGQQQTFEGAFFAPVGPDGLGAPRRVSGRGPQFATLIGVGSGEFVAAGDQEPLAILKFDSTGTLQWRRFFSRKLVLPTVAVSADRKILVVSQGGAYLQLQLLDESGRPLVSKQIAARQGAVVANSGGGWSILLSKGFGGKENRVYLTAVDPLLHQLSEAETPLRGRGGRTYQLISTPHGHLIIGESTEEGRQTIAEFDASSKLMWQQAISVPFTPLLVVFRFGFYVVKNVSEGEGMDVEKYLF
jgi:hypothetical protein